MGRRRTLVKEDPKKMGQRLAQLRKARGMSQSELAERVGSSQVGISNYELGLRRLPATLVPLLAKALDATTDELLGITAPTAPDGPNRSIWRKLRLVEQFPEKDRRMVLQLIETLAEKNLPA